MLSLINCINRLPPEAKPPLDGDAAAQKVTTISRINRVIERFHAEGKWKGLVQRGRIMAYATGNLYHITLPRWMETCLRGGEEGTKPMPTQSEWHQFISGGWGIRLEDENHWGPLQDMGEGYVTFRDIETSGQLTLVSDQSETTKYVWLRGYDTNGKKIFTTVGGNRVEGERVAVTNVAATTVNTFSSLYAVKKDVTSGFVTMTQNADTLAIYEPSETDISYRRYATGGRYDEVAGIFKRRSVWIEADNDIVYPSSVEAIKLGLFALQFEEQGEPERAEYYMAKATDLLNKELQEYQSGSEGTLQFGYGGLGGFIPHIN